MLDPTINIQNSGAINPFRSISRVETLSNSNVYHTVTSSGINAEWISEASEFADGSRTVGLASITPQKADAYVVASWELWQDSNIDQQLAKLFADAKDRLEATAFCTGTGSNQPYGLITRLSSTTASRQAVQTNGSFGAVDCFATAQALPPRWQPNAKWLASYQLGFTIRQFGVGASPAASAFWADLGSAQPPTLLGRPFIECSGMTGTLSQATASSDSILVYGSFDEFVVVDRLGATVVPNPVVLGSSRRPTGEIGMAFYWRTGSDTLTTDAFRVDRVMVEVVVGRVDAARPPPPLQVAATRNALVPRLRGNTAAELAPRAGHGAVLRGAVKAATRILRRVAVSPAPTPEMTGDPAGFRAPAGSSPVKALGLFHRVPPPLPYQGFNTG